MLHTHPHFNKVIASVVVIVIALAVVRGLSFAGTLSPSATPTATSYTLGDIYTRLTTNGTATAGAHSLTTVSAVGATFHSLAEIYAAIPTIDATKVLTGTTYLGVAGSASAGG